MKIFLRIKSVNRATDGIVVAIILKFAIFCLYREALSNNFLYSNVLLPLNNVSCFFFSEHHGHIPFVILSF